MNIKLALILLAGSMTASCAQTKLYSPVFSEGDGVYMTKPSTSNNRKSFVQAQRNAERFCLRKEKIPVFINQAKDYDGHYGNKKAASWMNKVPILNHLESDDAYTVELKFKCE